MANTAQAKKRAKQAEKSRIRNAGQRSNLRTFIKKVIAAVNAGDKEKAQAAYQTVVPIIDSAVNKGIIHKNKAARGKSTGISASVVHIGGGVNADNIAKCVQYLAETGWDGVLSIESDGEENVIKSVAWLREQVKAAKST